MGNGIKVLAIDQARNCGWSVWSYDSKELISSGTVRYGADVPFEEMLVSLANDMWNIVNQYEVDAVFFEDTQYQKNIDSFKKLCWLQGALIMWLRSNNVLYDIVPPSRWQGYCNARGRSASEIKTGSVKKGKALTIDFVRDKFGVDTQDDNMADAICIGFYAVNNIILRRGSS